MKKSNAKSEEERGKCTFEIIKKKNADDVKRTSQHCLCLKGIKRKRKKNNHGHLLIDSQNKGCGVEELQPLISRMSGLVDGSIA